MRTIVIVLFSFSVCGCAMTSLSGPERFWTGLQPQFAYEASSQVDLSRYKDFSVFAQSGLKPDSAIDPLEEKLILFIIRSQFEILGYRYVDDPAQADFFISAYYLNKYSDPSKQEEKVEIPEDIPEKTVEAFKANYQNLTSLESLNYFQDAKDNWGLPIVVEEVKEVVEEPKEEPKEEEPYDPWKERKIKIGDRPLGQMPREEKKGFSIKDRKPKSPEELEAEAKAREEKKAEKLKGHYLVFTEIVILDKESQESVWSGRALGTTLEEKTVLSVQNLVRNIFWGDERAFPSSRRLREEPIDVKDGSFGFFPHIRTSDGVSFYPFVGKIYLESPSYVQGIRPGDMITEIGGKSTLNLSFAEVLPGLDKAKGEALPLTVKQKEGTVSLEVIAEDEAVAKNSWNKFITEVY
jgi:hypothetical protein